MAGDWLKMEVSTPEKEEVLAITAQLGWDDADITVGKLFRLWRWFDQQTIDGNAARVTPALLDRIIGVTGFCKAVESVGWLHITDGGITLEKFDRHNGATAKSRAQTAKRVANHKGNGKGNGKGNAGTVSTGVSGALPREDIREDIGGDKSPPRGARKCPASFVVDDAMRTWALENAPLVDLDVETDKLRDHTFKTARSDWPGTWRNWMRKAQDDIATRPPTKAAAASFAASDREAGMARWEAQTGRIHPDRKTTIHAPGLVIDAQNTLQIAQ